MADYSKHYLHTQLSLYDGLTTEADWSKKRFKERLQALGALPSDDWSIKHMVEVELPAVVTAHLLEYDEFNDGEIAEYWTNLEFTESGGYLNCAQATIADLQQLFSDAEFDVFVKAELPEGAQAAGTLAAFAYVNDETSHAMTLSFRWDADLVRFAVRALASDGVDTDTEDVNLGLDGDPIYLRLKYAAATGKVQAYYATPYSEWIEITPSGVDVLHTVPAVMELVGIDANVGVATAVRFNFFKDATAFDLQAHTSTSTTTTTTTTTVAPTSTSTTTTTTTTLPPTSTSTTTTTTTST
jgi:hypothetical protein